MALKQFKNEPQTDFTKPANRKAMEKALARVKAMLGKDYPLVIGKNLILTEDKLRSINPSKPSEVVGSFSRQTLGWQTKLLKQLLQSSKNGND